MRGYEFYVLSLLYHKKEAGYIHRFLKAFPNTPNGAWVQEKLEDTLFSLTEVISSDVCNLILQY